MPADTIYDRWQAGDRDSPSLPLLELPDDKDKVYLFLRMEGKDGCNDDEFHATTGVELSRTRRWHLIFERMGVLYHQDSKTHLTDLGRALLQAEDDLKASRRRVARVAARTLRKYQLNNPAEQAGGGSYPDTCTIHPYWAVLRAADRLDGKLHWDEMNRELMGLLDDAGVDAAIERIRQARLHPGYDPAAGGTPAFPLKDRSHAQDNTDHSRDHIGTPWMRRASAGGFLLGPNSDSDGYRHIPEDLRDIVHHAGGDEA